MNKRLLPADIPLVPIDRGWAWIVAISSFFMFLLVGGSLKAYGVLYAELVSYSPQDAHKIIGLHAMVLTAKNLLTTIGVLLSQRFGSRVALTIGALATAIGYISSAFIATSRPSLMYITYSLIAGFGESIIFICTITAQAQYFTKHLAFALGLSQSGTGAGLFIWPHIFRVLFDAYGIEGALALIGAITLNACCFSALIRPIGFYTNCKRSLVPDYGFKESADNSIEILRGDSRIELRNVIEYDRSEIGLNGHTQTDEAASDKDGECARLLNDFKRKIAENISKMWIIVKSPVFVAYILSRFLLVSSLYPSLVIIPAYAIEMELSEYDIATIMTVYGAAELAGRIAVGALANMSFFDGRRSVICAILCVIFGISAILVTVKACRACLVVHAMITGSTGMTALSLQPVMIRDAFGVEVFPKVYALSVSFGGPFIVSSIYICQAFQTLTGSWAWPIRYTGILAMAVVVPLLAEFLNRKMSNGKTGNNKNWQ